MVIAVASLVCAGGSIAGLSAFLLSRFDAGGTTRTIRGSVAIEYGHYGNNTAGCFGRGGYDDLHVGTRVVITDATQRVVGVGEITATDERDWRCKLLFQVEGVPADSDFYSVIIANRDPLEVSAAEASKPLDLSLGR
ncbi:hypothetical protein GCM10009679_37170 [Saccharothrix algeriensis]|uniref:Uncharacterized protein n=2 Tax=Catellatospora bangladeshensis TaxID=310355 RepID=A0A8J3JNK5_9ACTN|nr:hypothetical protein Cba03nite_52070 [Catellatospora bangladeshensis]